MAGKGKKLGHFYATFIINFVKKMAIPESFSEGRSKREAGAVEKSDT